MFVYDYDYDDEETNYEELYNRRDSHGHHGSKRRELAQHAHTHMDWVVRIHSLTHFTSTTVTTTWCEAPAQALLFVSACWVISCLRNPPNSDMAGLQDL